MTAHHKKKAMLLLILYAIASFNVGVEGIVGNEVFESVRNLTDSFGDRHDRLFAKFKACDAEANSSKTTTGRTFQRIYITQDGSGGGGIGNLILKIKSVAKAPIDVVECWLVVGCDGPQPTALLTVLD